MAPLRIVGCRVESPTISEDGCAQPRASRRSPRHRARSRQPKDAGVHRNPDVVRSFHRRHRLSIRIPSTARLHSRPITRSPTVGASTTSKSECAVFWWAKGETTIGKLNSTLVITLNHGKFQCDSGGTLPRTASCGISSSRLTKELQDWNGWTGSMRIADGCLGGLVYSFSPP